MFSFRMETTEVSNILFLDFDVGPPPPLVLDRTPSLVPILSAPGIYKYTF